MVALIVDDAVFMRMALKNILIKDCGIDKADIYEAVDGAGALKQYCKAKPEIVFLDVHMPGQSAPKVVGELMKIDPNAKVVMCAVVGKREELLECAGAGARGYIKKPPQPEQMIQEIERVTGRKIKKPQPANAGDAAAPSEHSVRGNTGAYAQTLSSGAQVKGPSPEEQMLALRGQIGVLREDVLALKQLFESIDTGGEFETLKQDVLELGQLFESSGPD